MGVGGTGIVHEISQKSNGQRYAMKEIILHPNIIYIEKYFRYAFLNIYLFYLENLNSLIIFCFDLYHKV
jgi:hypothetical protein